MKARKTILGSVISIFAVVMTGAFLVYMSNAGTTLAFEVKGDGCDFELYVDDQLRNVGNLNPGDTVSSSLLVSNGMDRPLNYYVNLVRTDGRPGFGEPGDLFQQLYITISREGETLYRGFMSGFDDFSELEMGKLQGGEQQQIDVSIHLPGAGTGNEFQGATASVSWLFRTVCEEPSTPDSLSRSESSEPSLTIWKFFDANGNGTWDEGEAPLRGWVVYIDGRRYTTPVFLDLEPGTYKVCWEPAEDWICSTAEQYTITLDEKDDEVLLFGVHREESIVVTPDKPEAPPDEVEIPKTGELPPYLFYSLGFIMILVGILLMLGSVRRWR